MSTDDEAEQEESMESRAKDWFKTSQFPLELACFEDMRRADLHPRVSRVQISGWPIVTRFLLGVRHEHVEGNYLECRVATACWLTSMPWFGLCERQSMLAPHPSYELACARLSQAANQLLFPRAYKKEPFRIPALSPPSDYEVFDVVKGVDDHLVGDRSPMDIVAEMDEIGKAFTKPAATEHPKQPTELTPAEEVLANLFKTPPEKIFRLMLPCIVVQGGLFVATIGEEHSTATCSRVNSLRVHSYGRGTVYVVDSEYFPVFATKLGDLASNFLQSFRGLVTDISSE